MAELNRERYCERVMCESSSYIELLLRARSVSLEVVQKSSRERSCGPGRPPTQAVRPQFDQLNWNSRPTPVISADR
jgi:hypothetical protein